MGVASVQFRLDGVAFGPEDVSAPYAAGADTPSVTVTVDNGPPPDTTPPTVSLTSPASGSTVSGTVTVSASASDDVGVVAVQFRLDGANLGAEDTTAPYSVTWDTRAAADASHALTAVARDQANNAGTSAAVTVSNPPVSGGGDLFVARFNAQPLPGEAAFHLRLLPDGGLVVADAQAIVRLDAAGNQTRMYWVPGEPNYWGGLDIGGDGTFWATNAVNGNATSSTCSPEPCWACSTPAPGPGPRPAWPCVPDVVARSRAIGFSGMDGGEVTAPGLR